MPVLTDEDWARLAPLMPRAGARGGRPWADHRLVVEGIVWRYRTGSPWRDLPAEFGAWQTVWARHRAWSEDGTWDKIHAMLMAQADAAGRIDWSVLGRLLRRPGAASGRPRELTCHRRPWKGPWRPATRPGPGRPAEAVRRFWGPSWPSQGHSWPTPSRSTRRGDAGRSGGRRAPPRVTSWRELGETAKTPTFLHPPSSRRRL